MKYKMLKIRLSSWRKLRGAFPGKRDETFSEYLERIAEDLKDD